MFYLARIVVYFALFFFFFLMLGELTILMKCRVARLNCAIQAQYLININSV